MSVRSLVSFGLLLSFFAVVHSTAQAEISHDQLRRIATLAVQQNRAREIERAGFWIDEQCLYYRWGKYKRLSNRTRAERKPLQIPFDTQVRVELIRQWKWPKQAAQILNPVLAKVEHIVSHELALIEGGESAAALWRVLLRDEGETDRLFEDAIRTVAQVERRTLQKLRNSAMDPLMEIALHRQRTVIFPPLLVMNPNPCCTVVCCPNRLPCGCEVVNCCPLPSECAPPPMMVAECRALFPLGRRPFGDDTYSITFRTDPPNADIFYLTEKDYDVAMTPGPGDQKPTLTQKKKVRDFFQASRTEDLGGIHHFCIVWPNSEVEDKGNYDIDSDREYCWVQKKRP